MAWDENGKWIEPDFGEQYPDLETGTGPSFDQSQNELGQGMGGLDTDLQTDLHDLIGGLFPDVWDSDVASSDADWWNTYGGYFSEYDPLRENIRSRQRDLEVFQWGKKMLKDKNTLDFNKGSSGFVTSGRADEYESDLTHLGQVEFLQGQMSEALDVYGFKEDWQAEQLGMASELGQLGAFLGESYTEADNDWDGYTGDDDAIIPGDMDGFDLDDEFSQINCEDGGHTWISCSSGGYCSNEGYASCEEYEEGVGDIDPNDCAASWPEDACVAAGGVPMMDSLDGEEYYSYCHCPDNSFPDPFN